MNPNSGFLPKTPYFYMFLIICLFCLKQEQKSKRLLEEELSYLRRDYALLLEKVKRIPILPNGIHKSFKKTLES